MTAYPSCGRVLRVFRACFARQEAPWLGVLRVFRVLRGRTAGRSYASTARQTAKAART
jgi:hypothetical protein